VWPCGGARSDLIGGKALVSRHLMQRRWISIAGVGTVGMAQERANWTARLFHLLRGIAPILDIVRRAERPDLGERNESTAVESR
jgi:hypothetical protein